MTGFGDQLLEAIDRELEDTTYRGEPGDEEKFSHYAKKEAIDKSWLTGEPVVALCGKKWVPTRDPEKFPVCQACREIYEHLAEGK